MAKGDGVIFKEFIYKTRMRAGLSQEAVARLMDISTTQFRRYEYGLAVPMTSGPIKALAAALSVSYEKVVDAVLADRKRLLMLDSVFEEASQDVYEQVSGMR